MGDRDIQLILREVPSEALIIALKGAKDEMKESSSATCRGCSPT